MSSETKDARTSLYDDVDDDISCCFSFFFSLSFFYCSKFNATADANMIRVYMYVEYRFLKFLSSDPLWQLINEKPDRLARVKFLSDIFQKRKTTFCVSTCILNVVFMFSVLNFEVIVAFVTWAWPQNLH